jgi:hypothetical protein
LLFILLHKAGQLPDEVPDQYSHVLKQQVHRVRIRAIKRQGACRIGLSGLGARKAQVQHELLQKRSFSGKGKLPRDQLTSNE